MSMVLSETPFEKTTYKVEYKCSNCGDSKFYELELGQRITEELDGKKCWKCKCDIIDPKLKARDRRW